MSYFTERAKQLGFTGGAVDAGQSQAGESYFQRRARELGLQPAAPAQQPASAPVSNFFTNRAMDLGIIPDERHTDYHNKIDTTDLTIHPKGEPAMPPFSGNTPSQAAPSVQPDYLKPQAAPGSFQAIQDFQQRTPLPEPTSAKQQFYEQEAAARDKQLAGAPGFIKKPLELLGHGLDVVQANIPGLADFQQGAGRTLGVEAETAPTTGGVLGKVANIAGQFAGGAVNPAVLEQSVATGADRIATGALQRFAPTANPFVQRLAGNAAEGAAQNVANTAATGRTSARDIAEAAALGGVGGAAFEAAGTGMKRLIGGRQPAGAALPETATPQPELLALPLGRADLPEQALHITDAPLASKELSFNRPEPIRGKVGEPEVLPASSVPEQPRIDITPRPLPQQPSSQSLGFSAFGKKAGAYDNLRTSTKSQLVSRQKREKMPAKALRGKLYTDWVDDLHPMDRFDKEVEAVTGEKLGAEDRSHTLALNSRGADVIAKQILTARQVDSKGRDIGKSLKEILAPLPQHEHSYVDFEDYLVNRHAITRMEKRGERVFREDLHWTPDEGRQILADYEAAYPQFKTMAGEIDKFQRNMAQHWLVDTGLLPQKSLDQWLDENPTYVPNKRYFSELEKTGAAKGGKKKGYGNQSAPVKGYTPGGSERLIISPIEAMIENVDAFVKAAKRNEAMQSFAGSLERDPDALSHFAEFVPEEQVAGTHSLKGLNDTLNSEGIEGVIAKLGEDFDLSFRKATQRGLDKDNIVRVMIDGEPKYIQINDKPLLEAITAMGPDASNVVMDFFGKVTGAFKTLTTGVNPVFSLTRNIMRDIPQAYAASKSTNNPARFMADLVQSAWAIARNKELYQEYLNMGGGHASPAAADRNLLAQSKRQILPQRGSKLKGIVPRGYDKLQNMLNAVESAPRLGEFKRVGANAEGVAAAQDVTVNFKRRGRHGKQFDKALPYFNAAVQGLDKTVRMFKDAPPQAIAKTALAVSLPAMISYAINHNDTDYQQVSKRTKDNFYLLPKGDGTFWKIAKPKELGTVFADIPERLLQVFAHQDPDAFRDFADQLRTTFTVPGVQGALKSGGITDRLLGAVGDTVGGPIADVAANQNFAGAPIVPGYLQNLSPELQSDPRTSIVAKKVGEWTGTSPKALDYLFKQYTGILGQLGQPLLSPGGSVGNTLVQQVTTDPVYSNDISDKFYDAKGKLDQARADFPVTGELPAGYNDGLRKSLGKISDAMSGVRKQMRDIEADLSIPAATKRKQLRDLQERINQMGQDGNDLVRQSK